MKTIREICELKKIEHVRCGGDVVSWIIDALEAREKERDEAERERVKARLINWMEAFLYNRYGIDRLVNAVFPPPEPPKPALFPAGWYEETYDHNSNILFKHLEPFKPIPGRTYRRLVYEDEQS